ncbi:hypothetical protein TEA_023454 [Camellia sinensis var. sinensis]|uniref:Uncharacterized protein n=1 Tax=Camellia sinensis var. sinensis TaxID=542762 RepID=A0A4S4DL17_CAMSN|nr:hypothetical protein TEA_023454 [Camellia sinensis var. sinensis]
MRRVNNTKLLAVSSKLLFQVTLLVALVLVLFITLNYPLPQLQPQHHLQAQPQAHVQVPKQQHPVLLSSQGQVPSIPPMDSKTGGMARRESVIEHKVHVRVGLLGNPSDVYYGRTISFSLSNFSASVRLNSGGDTSSEGAGSTVSHRDFDLNLPALPEFSPGFRDWFLSLLNSNVAFNCEIIRDCYEAFALYCFERYLIACLGGEENTIEFMERQSLSSSSIPLLEEAYAYGVVEHPFPLNCFLRDWHLGSDFYQAVKVGIVQYLWSLNSLGFMVKGNLSGDMRSFLRRLLFWRIMMINYVKQMGVAAVVHFYVFPAVPYKRGERCARNVAVMTDYASLGSPLDPEEIQDSERSTRINLAHHNEREERLSFPQSVRDVIVDDMKFTVSHVVEPVERGIAKINKTFHQISENVKWLEEQRKNSKDDSYLIPLNSRAKEFSEVDNDDLIRGSVSDSGLSNGKEQRHHTKATASRFIRSR